MQIVDFCISSIRQHHNFGFWFKSTALSLFSLCFVQDNRTKCHPNDPIPLILPATWLKMLRSFFSLPAEESVYFCLCVNLAVKLHYLLQLVLLGNDLCERFPEHLWLPLFIPFQGVAVWMHIFRRNFRNLFHVKLRQTEVWHRSLSLILLFFLTHWKRMSEESLKMREYLTAERNPVELQLTSVFKIINMHVYNYLCKEIHFVECLP